MFPPGPPAPITGTSQVPVSRRGLERADLGRITVTRSDGTPKSRLIACAISGVSCNQTSAPPLADSEATLEGCEVRDCLKVGEPVVLEQSQREIDYFVVDQMHDVGVSQEAIGPETGAPPNG